MGPDFDIKKRVSGAEVAENLGIQCDFTSVPSHALVTLSVTRERKDKLRELMRGYFSNHIITRTQSQKLYGTARWVVCPIFGRVGLSLLMLV